ncbi:hypothetical protein BKG85_04890 [Mycobacteroides chelonae]|nr:hypothetical protein BKG85_04890 [Mycobacteroides chelonae]
MSTPTGRLSFHGDQGQKYLANIPAGRIAVSAEIAGAAIYLASDAASMVNGADLAIDGGYHNPLTRIATLIVHQSNLRCPAPNPKVHAPAENNPTGYGRPGFATRLCVLSMRVTTWLIVAGSVTRT